MKKKNFIGILIFSAVIMLLSSFHLSSFASEVEKAKENKTSLEKKIEETEARISELEKKKDDIISYIEELDKELGRLLDEIETTNLDIQTAKEELTAAQEELKLARITEENQYTVMKNRIMYMYENGQTDYLEIIMNSDNLADMMNQVEYMSKITEYDNNLLDEYIKLKEDVIAKEEAQQTKLAELNELKDKLTYEQETVERLASDKNKELVKYEESIRESQSLSAEFSSKLEEQEMIIEQLLEAERLRIEAEQRAEEERRRKEQEKQEQAASTGGVENSGSTSTIPSNNSFSGDFTWPVPSSTRITSKFGNRDQPTAGASSNHKGIDIGASTGTPIVAAASGTVVTATYSVSAGNYIMISHGDSTYTVYMHCSDLYVASGDQVSKGQQIAAIGNTGISTGSHLHFGISMSGNYVNPLDYVSY